MAKRKQIQYAEVVLHSTVTDSTDMLNMVKQDHPKLIEVVSAYAEAIRVAFQNNKPISILDLSTEYNGEHITFILGTDDGFRCMKISYEIKSEKYYIAVFTDSYGNYCDTHIRSNKHSYVMNRAKKAIQSVSSISKDHLSSAIERTNFAYSRRNDRTIRELESALTYSMKGDTSVPNLKYHFSEEQIEELALYAFSPDTNPKISDDVVRKYEEWRKASLYMKDIEARVAEDLDKPRWVVLVCKRGLNKPDDLIVGLVKRKEVLIPFQLYKSFDKLPDDIRNELMVSLTMAKVYAAGKGMELDGSYAPKEGRTYRNNRVVYQDIGYVHEGEGDYSVVSVYKL